MKSVLHRIGRIGLDVRALAERRDALWLLCLGLAGIATLLALGLVAVALRPRPHLLVPGVARTVEVRPGDVPDDAALAFARAYLLAFDNYTPATIERSTAGLKASIASRHWSQISDDLDRRIRVVQEGRMSTQALPGLGATVRRAPDGTLVVRLPATRRIYIADRLSRESPVVYEIALESCPVTPSAPNGLAVVSQRVEEEGREAPGRRP